MLEPQLRRIHPQLLGDLVEVHLEREPRLRRAVAPLRTTRWLVRERSCALKLVTWNVIGDGLQRPRVVRARDAVGAVPTAVQQRLEVHRRDRPVPFHAGFHPHERRMAPAVTVKDLLAGEGDLHRPPREDRELRHHDLVTERVALAAEAAAVGRGDDADLGGGELEHLGEGAVHIVRRLGRAPERELAVGQGRPVGHRRVLLHRQMRAALEEEQVLAHQIRRGEPLVHVAELEVDEFVDVAAVAVVVDAGLGVRHRILSVRDRAQRLVGHVDQVERGGRDFLTHRGDACHRVAHEAHLVARQGMLILAHGQNPEGDRQVSTRQHSLHTRQGLGSRGINTRDAGVGMGTAEQLGVQHAGEEEVVGESRHAGDFGGRVHFADRRADHAQGGGRALTASHTGSPVPASHPRPADGPRPALRPRRSSRSRCSGTGCPTRPA